MSPKQLLELTEAFANEEAVENGEIAKKHISAIYRFVHGSSKRCPHSDWEKEAQEEWKILKKEGII